MKWSKPASRDSSGMAYEYDSGPMVAWRLVLANGETYDGVYHEYPLPG
jgi:hypothetical protein